MITDTRVTQLIAKVRELAKERPSNKYLNKPCFYLKGNCSDNTIGCIFGQALVALGYSFVESGAMNIDVLLQKKFDFALTLKQRVWICRVQVNQDADKTWAQSVQEADETIANDFRDGIPA
jgi:hypothetical protein